MILCFQLINNKLNIEKSNMDENGKSDICRQNYESIQNIQADRTTECGSKIDYKF